MAAVRAAWDWEPASQDGKVVMALDVPIERGSWSTCRLATLGNALGTGKPHGQIVAAAAAFVIPLSLEAPNRAHRMRTQWLCSDGGGPAEALCSRVVPCAKVLLRVGLGSNHLSGGHEACSRGSRWLILGARQRMGGLCGRQEPSTLFPTPGLQRLQAWDHVSLTIQMCCALNQTHIDLNQMNCAVNQTNPALNQTSLTDCSQWTRL